MDAHSKTILFLGGDKRQQYAAAELQHIFDICAEGLDEDYPSAAERSFSALILPVPAVRGSNINAPLSPQAISIEKAFEYSAQCEAVFGGAIPKELRTRCESNGTRVFDLLEDEECALKNAWLTAENAAALLIQNSDGSIYGSRALITGYGRCAIYTARLLKALGARVTICARNPEQRAKAALDGHFAIGLAGLKAAAGCADYIVNTIPAHIFDENTFCAVKKGAVFMELASLPPISAEQLAKNALITYIHAAGLPGKYSPKAAGKLIAEFILEKLSPSNANSRLNEK